MILNTVYQSDCLEVMKDFPDGCIDLTVTSPPYDNLRDYKGYEFNFEGIAQQLYRVTKKGGVLVWVVNHSTIDGSETLTSFKQALYFKEIGFNVHDTMIYRKNNPIPLNHDRYEQCFEYMFVLSKGKPKTFNPIKVNCKTYGSSNRFGDGLQKNFVKEQGIRAMGESKILTVKKDKIHENIFSYSVGKDKKGHPAPFPEYLVRDHIISWSNPGDIVLDPMAGSGTTLKMAKVLERNYIGIEISHEYCDIINNRLKNVQMEVSV